MNGVATGMGRYGRALAIAAVAGLSGCGGPFAMTAMGVGASTAVSHTMTGISYRTFTLPLPKVKTASLSALKRMGIKVAGTERKGDVEIVNATARDREIAIELEPLTPSATRMRVTAKNGGILYDSATSTEIIQQTAKALGVV